MARLALIGVVVLLAATLVACQQPPQQSTASTPTISAEYPNASLLVDVDWLSNHLSDSGVRVVDVRSPGDYNSAHVPGAVNIPISEVASSIDGVPLEFDRAKVQNSLNNAGITPETTVVLYDNLGMMDAARVFWTLEYVGHQDVRVVNGGWNAWTAAGLDTQTAAPQIEPTDYPIELDASKFASAEDVLAKLGDPNVAIVDARSPQEYTGEVKLASRGGHIPGAVNLVWLDALTGGDTVYATDPNWRAELQDPDVEVFKPASEIRAMLDSLGVTPDKEVITYCQTFWRGAHLYFLLRLMGFQDVRGYDGSWAEWGNHADLPVVTGPDPGSPPVAAGTTPSVTETVTSTIFLIATGDNGQTGKQIGCGDSVVPVEVSIDPASAPLTATLETLLALDSRDYGQSGLYNALYQSDLHLAGVDVDEGDATVRLTGSLTLGGECDDPRVKAQIEETTLQFPAVHDVSVFVNGEPLD